jgi:hypothetical protein
VAELAWTRHPAAIPYLEKAIAAEVNPILFDALVEIGTAEARNAVIRLTGHATPWVANGAKGALARFGPGKSMVQGPKKAVGFLRDVVIRQPAGAAYWA